MFPLFKLPLLCVQEVTNLWEPIELYNFSLLSKKAKGISKKKKGNNLIVHLEVNNVSLCLYQNQNEICEMGFKKKRFLVGKKGELRNNKIPSFIKATQHFMDVFNCPFGRLDIDLAPLTNANLIRIIDWLNGMKNEIRTVYIFSAPWPMFELFVNRFQKSICGINIFDLKFESEPNVCKRVNFEIKYLFYSNRADWIQLDFLLKLTCEGIFGSDFSLSAKDLNVFLRSWQEGKTNKNLKRFDFILRRRIDMLQVLKGCKGELMDPRTTQIKYRDKEDEFSWGVHIKRNDGRLAVIEIVGHDSDSDSDDEDEDLTLDQKYLKALEIWNSGDENYSCYQNKFNFYIDDEL